MSDITKIKVDGEPESSYKLFPKNREFEKRAGGNTGSQSGVQSDWNQNDNTQPDYVKNRPFYTEDHVETVLVEESTVEFRDNSGKYGAFFPTSFNAEFGATYKVSWDGSIYTCACKNINNIPVIGNQSFIGGDSDTDKPFVIFNQDGLMETGWVSVATDTSASHTISISSFTGGIVKIDEKYLPDSIISDISTAQSTANAAQSTANAAQSTANAAQSTANKALPRSGGVIEIDNDLNATLTLGEFTGSTGTQKRGIRIGGHGAYGNPILEVIHDDITIYDRVSQRRIGGLNGTELFLTAKNSDKTFKITVDDSGALTATEVI